MSSRSSIRTCVCCKKSGNNCKKLISVTSNTTLSNLMVCFATSNVSSGMDVCAGCISKAKWERIKANKASNTTNNLENNNENSISKEIDSLNIGNLKKYFFLIRLID